jgi:hypothetical protein
MCIVHRARIFIMGPRYRFQGIKSASLYSLAGRYDNPIPPRFLAPIDFLKIPALLYSLAELCNPPPPHLGSYIRGRYLSAEIDDIDISL